MSSLFSTIFSVFGYIILGFILKKINIILDKDSGEPRLSHKIDISTGMYKGRQILKKKTEENK